MATLNIFQADAFSLMSLTEAILKAPYRPGRLGQLGLFLERGITTTTVAVEEKAGQLTLIPTTPRGAPADTLGAAKRTARSFLVPHLTREATILADSIQNVRAFGSENEVEAVQMIVNERLAELRQQHEVTLEHHRIGAIKGTILDSDGSTTIYNLFTEFGVVQQTQDFAFTTATTNIRGACITAARAIESELGATMYTGLRGLCSAEFFDALVSHATVTEAYKYQEGRMLAADLRTAGFQFGGVTWEEYRGSVGGVAFIAANTAYLVPEGTDIFGTYYAPADFNETVNTVGLPLYAKQAVDPEFQRWTKLHTQSNPLCLCLRPRAVIKCTMS